MNNNSDIIIIGGGLAGLTAATYLARAGRSVTLLERARQLGGRAITQNKDDFYFNLGPHALYLGEAHTILKELNIPFSGSKPPATGYKMLHNNQLYPFPMTAGAMLSSKLFKFSDRLQMLKIMATILRTNPKKVAHLSLHDWVQQQSNSAEIHAFLFASARVGTYANAPEEISAEIFLQQTQLSLKKSVLYLDQGWQTLVDGLRKAAIEAGTTIITNARVETINEEAPLSTVHLADGSTWQGQAVLLTVDPQTAVSLLPHNHQLRKVADTAVPVRAACLDIGLQHLPNPDITFALGLKQPLYFSVHSAAATLAPKGAATIHVAKYLPTEPSDATQDRKEMEALLDFVQPGWRKVLVTERYLPNMLVINRLAAAAEGGINGRPDVTLSQANNLYLAGDWVGDKGWLVDASLASARTAAQRILQNTNPLTTETSPHHQIAPV